jgi:perosamine synthetase
MIPVFRPSCSDAEIAAVTEALRSGWWGIGPKTAEFEKAFAHYLGVPESVGLNSATAALHLALKVLGVEGGEVITTPMTFISTNHAILYNGATPVFCDVEPDTLNIDPAWIERSLTPRTKAIMVVHYGGHPVDLDAIRGLAGARGIPVVEDAAHACGSRYKGRLIGSDAEMACFSFHAVKNLAMGEGGAIVARDAAHLKRIRHLRWMGINKDTWERAADGATYSWAYNVEEVGFKYHLSDISAAIGIAQLGRLEELNERRRAIVHRYDEAFAGLAWLTRPVEKAYSTSSRHNYVVRVDRRDDFMKHLGARGVMTGMHYIPNHLYEMYRPYRRALPVVEREWQRVVTLPLFPSMTESEVGQVVDAVRSFPAPGTS